jgi:hypothetical protein
VVAKCAECDERIVIPLHLIADEVEQPQELYCASCGARMSAFIPRGRRLNGE